MLMVLSKYFNEPACDVARDTTASTKLRRLV